MLGERVSVSLELASYLAGRVACVGNDKEGLRMAWGWVASASSAIAAWDSGLEPGPELRRLISSWGA